MLNTIWKMRGLASGNKLATSKLIAAKGVELENSIAKGYREGERPDSSVCTMRRALRQQRRWIVGVERWSSRWGCVAALKSRFIDLSFVAIICPNSKGSKIMFFFGG